MTTRENKRLKWRLTLTAIGIQFETSRQRVEQILNSQRPCEPRTHLAHESEIASGATRIEAATTDAGAVTCKRCLRCSKVHHRRQGAGMRALTWQSQVSCPDCGSELELLTQATRSPRDHIAVLQCEQVTCREPWVLTRTLDPMKRSQARA
jgi:transposase-like protein